MRIESDLCFISENKAIVKVSGWDNDHNLGSALAEGISVDDAEDKAISKLHKRLNTKETNQSTSVRINSDFANTSSKVEIPNSNKIEKNNIVHEPCDWSTELTAIDAEIERLKWSRDDEINFLEKTFGYNNRSKITNYSDIVKYLNILKKLDKDIQSKFERDNINTLISQSDKILREMSWDHIQGREYLLKEYNVSTRKELNEEQLISFVQKLKSIRNQYQNQ
tara:strand:- start:105 stop:773 length:669 start_codon:yes stop_codon:yes gene_type:complete